MGSCVCGWAKGRETLVYHNLDSSHHDKQTTEYMVGLNRKDTDADFDSCHVQLSFYSFPHRQ